MTQISYIAGPPLMSSREISQRAKNVPVRSYLPFTQMTEGEARLAIALESLKVDSAFYPESRAAQKAVRMIENALYGGISGGVEFVGAIPNELQPIARLIATEARYNRPASIYHVGRQTRGIRIGDDPIIPNVMRDVDCKRRTYDMFKAEHNGLSFGEKAKRFPPLGLFPPYDSFTFDKYMKFHLIKSVRNLYSERLLGCEYAKTVETVLNDRLERSSMHMLYHTMSSAFEPALGTLALTKRLLHKAGVSDIATLAGVKNDIMSGWVELGQKRSAVSAGAKPQPAAVYAAALTPDPELYVTQVLADIKTRGGATGIGEPISVTIGAITAVVASITAALLEARKLTEAFNANKIQALTNAQGFGTDAFSPEKNDFLKAKGDTPLTPPSDSEDNNLLLIGGAAAAYFLLK